MYQFCRLIIRRFLRGAPLSTRLKSVRQNCMTNRHRAYKPNGKNWLKTQPNRRKTMVTQYLDNLERSKTTSKQA